MPIYKVKGRYYVRVEKNGVKWTPAKAGMHQTSWKTKRHARAAEAELRHRIEKLKTTPTSLDFLTLCNEYLKDAKISFVGHDTFAGKQRLCKELLEKWGNLPVEDITVHMAQTYLLERANSVSNNSFNVYRQEGKRLFNWGANQELFPNDMRNPFAEVKKKKHEKGKHRPAPIDHVVKAYMAATPVQKDLILCYLITGARKSEILKWEWKDIDFSKRIYALHTRKSGTSELKTTYHEIPDVLYEVLQRRFKKRHPTLPYVFWHKFWDQKENRWREDRYMSLNKFSNKLCKRANVPTFHLHQLRHLATSILKELADMGLAKLQRFLRHDKQKTTEIYAGHLETGTKEQTDFLADFWRKALGEPNLTSNPSSNCKKKKGYNSL